MRTAWRLVRGFACLAILLGMVWACGFDDTLREYLSGRFWLPFAKHPASFEKSNVRRTAEAYAGMTPTGGDSPLARLRATYQQISPPVSLSFDPAPQRQAVAVARADRSLTRREKEEVDLIDAKIEMRAAGINDRDRLERAAAMLKTFLRTASTPAFRSEARGWLGHVYYLLGDRTAAGKIYLDELNRNGSNLSREILLDSLKELYGYDGGPDLLAHLEDYFDTAEHAAFAIQLVTNPHWERYYDGRRFEQDHSAEAYPRIRGLLEKHSQLLESGTLSLLAMRTALRMGDPAGAGKIAAKVPSNAPVRADSDFNWILASSHFLSGNYAVAERPLLMVFQSRRSPETQKAAAAYGLCGVYRKLGNPVEQLRYALWLHTAAARNGIYFHGSSGIADLSVYWASSGWDLDLLLDSEAPIEALQKFISENPDVPDLRLVRYSLAVRLARENRYEEAAEIYRSIHANRRAPRMSQLGALYREAARSDLPDLQKQEAGYRLAQFIGSNPNGIYYNDALWRGLQRYAMQAAEEWRLTEEERTAALAGERKLQDDQEERWRAYLILRDIVQNPASPNLHRKSASLALRCLRGINTERFGREAEILKADIELSARLRRATPSVAPASDPPKRPVVPE